MHQASKPTELFDKYEEHKEKLREFIRDFVDPEMTGTEGGRDRNKKKYMMKLVSVHLLQMSVANGLTNTVEILVEDLQEFFGKGDESEMVKAFTTNTKRYISLFEQVIQELMPARTMHPEGDDVQSVLLRKSVTSTRIF